MLDNMNAKINATVYWNMPIRMREDEVPDFELSEWAGNIRLWHSMISDADIELGTMDYLGTVMGGKINRQRG